MTELNVVTLWTLNVYLKMKTTNEEKNRTIIKTQTSRVASSEQIQSISIALRSEDVTNLGMHDITREKNDITIVVTNEVVKRMTVTSVTHGNKIQLA